MQLGCVLGRSHVDANAYSSAMGGNISTLGVSQLPPQPVFIFFLSYELSSPGASFF